MDWVRVTNLSRQLVSLKTQSIFFSVTPLLPVKWRSSRSNNSAARAIIHKRIGVCESPREDLSRAQNFMSKLKLAAFCRVFEFLDWSLALSPV